MQNLLQVIAALHFFGQGSYQKSVGADCGAVMSQSQVSKCVDEVVTAINTAEVLSHHIVFPATPAARARLIQK